MRRHIHLHGIILVSITLLAMPLHADVTLRYKSEVTLNPRLRQQLAQQMMKTMNVSLPTASVQQFRNGKLFYLSGKQNSIIDLEKREITLLDNDGKRYATVPVERYGDELARAMPEVTPAAKAALAAMKGHSESTSTGRTATIQGVEAEERNIVMTLDYSPGPGLPDAPMMRMVMHLWTAKASEGTRVAAIREVAGYDLLSIDAINPVGTMQKAFQQIPGVKDAFLALMRDLQSGGTPVMLRTQMELFMPMIGTLTKQMPAGAVSPFGAGFDPDAPLAQVTQEVAEISNALLPDSVFQVPEGYKSATTAEILRDMAAKAPTVQANPNLISQVSPVYPPLAKAARVQGTVSFSATIGKDGAVKTLQLVSGPPLLVQAAMDAVKKWVYNPTLLNGGPVEVLTTINVNFALGTNSSAAPAQ